MKVTLTGVWHNATNKAGQPFMSKAGKPYERCSIKTAQHGEKYLSGFGNKTTKTWQVGEEVDILVEENGEYLNFSLPKVEVGGLSELDREMFMRIEKKLDNVNWYIVEMAKAFKNKVPMYPTPEVEGIDVQADPFGHSEVEKPTDIDSSF